MLGFPRPETVTPIPLAALARLLSVPVDAEPGRVEVTGVSLASARVRPGDLYVAVPGARRHGAEFLAEAVERGAVAVLSDSWGVEAAVEHGLPALHHPDPRAAAGVVSSAVYGEPTKRLSVIGITGTSGKTSTAYLVEAGLKAAGRVTGLIGTVETRIGAETIVSERTTPEATELQALFAYALEQGVTDIVMEVSSHALTLHRAEGISFAVGGFTMFGLDHLDFHPTVDEYFAAKAKLFDGRCRVEVVNADDAWAKRLVTPDTVTYSLVDANATWSVDSITGSGFDQSFEVTSPHGRHHGSVRLPGRHNIANALLAYGCLTAVGVPVETAIAGVADCAGVPGRMELVSEDNPVHGVVDYAHKPDAITAVLEALRPITSGSLIAVIGAGGDRDPSKRTLMGDAAARAADLVIVTDDNPRTEDPAAVRAGVLAGVGDRPHLEVADRATAIDEAVARAKPGDTIALLGKGHESGQELADRVLPFDDRRVLADALSAARP
ncbi:UDP-N-acetylmuramoyl-L-alanyl-D-glutamate--2,6-diaminopimelate ligase [Stackebrandtia nassauensis]|uniref:UDP-N-acetylmuramoyl-L-alanyl-D-glutamate--2,6-diaminopimelate ligase n=1 Tax=Stackebrandtia nassauensis (strain DSM 44728 / CIP 108903 / NRRL B-16338 / NBRC 102104 / LLR-40K-21) TaxID=446470 RepID=D3PZY1_STANL|nr:UDP-N-acetylmuramoyl-L-alanyl-D-glutamate--2,6-diaminopimelate ligase [Stackebrandtia nassauensis]ADD43668.1 UDP-N-acetylmuramyl-tripeptide synthetase [Stackebrandtia nassauensis DSM 44728]